MDDKIPSFEQALDGKYEETYGQARADRRALGPCEKIGAWKASRAVQSRRRLAGNACQRPATEV